MASSLGFGSPSLSKNGLLTLAFTQLSSRKDLNKESKGTRWLVLQKARHHRAHNKLCASALALCGHNGFRFYFTALNGLLFTFPSRYWFTIGDIVVFSLGLQFGLLPSRFSYLEVLKKNIKEHKTVFVYRTITFFGRPFQGRLTNKVLSKCSPSRLPPTIFSYNPHQCESTGRFRLFPVRSPLLRKLTVFSFPLGTMMFRFPRFTATSNVANRV